MNIAVSGSWLPTNNSLVTNIMDVVWQDTAVNVELWDSKGLQGHSHEVASLVIPSSHDKPWWSFCDGSQVHQRNQWHIQKPAIFTLNDITGWIYCTSRTRGFCWTSMIMQGALKRYTMYVVSAIVMHCMIQREILVARHLRILHLVHIVKLVSMDTNLQRHFLSNLVPSCSYWPLNVITM